MYLVESKWRAIAWVVAALLTCLFWKKGSRRLKMMKRDEQAPEKKACESDDIDDLLAGSGSSSSPSTNREEQEREQTRQKMEEQDEEKTRLALVELYFKVSKEMVQRFMDEDEEENTPAHVKVKVAQMRLAMDKYKKHGENNPPAPPYKCDTKCHICQRALLKSKLDGAAPSSGDVQEKEKKEDMPDSKDTQEGAVADEKN